MKRFEEWHPISCVLLGAGVGLAIGLMIVSAAAHTPCNNDFELVGPKCKYVQVVNPYTGQLETHYVCK